MYDHSILSPVLVGREEPLQTFARVLGQIRQRRGQIIALTGEAGIGKSRLAAELKTRAQQENLVALQGRCFEQDRGLPYAPLIELLHNFMQRAGANETLAPFAPELGSLVPELATLSPQTLQTSPLEPEQEKRRLFQTLAQFFGTIAPALILIEDLHWCDAATLEFLLYLARQIEQEPILLLLTCRNEEDAPALTHFLATLEREHLVTELSLRPLSRAQTQAMVQAIFAQPKPIRADFLDALYGLTEGNPFFLEEVLKALVASGDIFFSAGEWTRKPMGEVQIPRTVADAVYRRSDDLSGDAHRVLGIAAVIGKCFDFSLLQALTGFTESMLLAQIKDLIAAQLVVEESAERFAFRHALTCQAIYAQFLARERQALHRHIAETLTETYATSPHPPLGELAYHFYAAGAWAQALAWSQRAGEQAAGLSAPRTAIEHFSQALDAATRMEMEPSAELLCARGEAYETLGEFELARGDYEQALGAAEAANHRILCWRALLDLGFLWTSRDYARAGDYLQRALDAARALDDSAALGHTLNRIGNWYANLDQPRIALDYHGQAQQLFQARADTRGLAETLDLLGLASYFDGDVFQGVEYYRQAIELWRGLGDRGGLTSSLVMYATRGANYLHDTLSLPVTGVQEQLRDAQDALDMAREMGWRSGECFALIYLAFGLGPRGEYALALPFAQTSLSIARELEHRQWMLASNFALGMIALDLFDMQAAKRHLTDAYAIATELGSRFTIHTAGGLLAHCLVAQNQIERAAEILNTLLDAQTPMQTQAQRLLWAAHAEYEVARSNFKKALQILDGLFASSVHANAASDIARLAFLRGKTLAALVPPKAVKTRATKSATQAEAALRAAAEGAQAHGFKPLLWQIQAQLGKLYRTLGDKTQAEREFADARRVIEALAADVPEAALRETFLQGALAQLPRTHPPTPRQAARQAAGGLTAREREVARLIARGKTNRAIAKELVLSERTVEGYVSNLLAKLSFETRSQIAAWAAEHGLLSV